MAKGTDPVRGCQHVGNTRAEVSVIVDASIAWAGGIGQDGLGQEGDRTGIEVSISGMRPSGGNLF